MSAELHRTTSVFDYSDYRTFLATHFEVEKKRQKSFSTRFWCKKLGIKSTATLNMILRGHRDPGPDVVEKFATYFAFDRDERLFFEQLVRLAKQSDPTKRCYHMQRLQDLHPKKVIELLSYKAFNVMSHWYCLAIREMVQLKDFSPDPTWIARRLKYKVGLPKIAQTLQTLQQLNLLHCDDTGKWHQTQEEIGTSHDIAQEAIKQFHEQMLTLASESIRNTPLQERLVTGITFNIKKEDLPALREELFRLQKAVYQKYQVPTGDETYQFNIQVFPLTKSVD